MSANGRASIIVCGRIIKLTRELLTDSIRDRRPDAFSMIDRSIMDIRGATSVAAAAADIASAARRHPRFFVFHSRCDFDDVGISGLGKVVGAETTTAAAVAATIAACLRPEPVLPFMLLSTFPRRSRDQV